MKGKIILVQRRRLIAGGRPSFHVKWYGKRVGTITEYNGFVRAWLPFRPMLGDFKTREQAIAAILRHWEVEKG